MVEDLGSVNGTFVNGLRIIREVARHGDGICFATQRFRLVVSGQPEPVAPFDSAASNPGCGWEMVALLALAVASAVTLFP